MYDIKRYEAESDLEESHDPNKQLVKKIKQIQK